MPPPPEPHNPNSYVIPNQQNAAQVQGTARPSPNNPKFSTPLDRRARKHSRGGSGSSGKNARGGGNSGGSAGQGQGQGQGHQARRATMLSTSTVNFNLHDETPTKQGLVAPGPDEFPPLGAQHLGGFDLPRGGAAGNGAQRMHGRGMGAGGRGHNRTQSTQGPTTNTVTLLARPKESLVGRPGGFNETPEQVAARKIKPLPRRIARAVSASAVHSGSHGPSVPGRFTSTPNPNSMTSAAGTSLTHRSAEYEVSKQFDRLKIQGQHLGLRYSPYFPMTKEELIRHREERKHDLKNVMTRKIKMMEEIMRLKEDGKWIRIVKAFGGKKFRDGLSGVFAHVSVWVQKEGEDMEGEEGAEWPSLGGLKDARGSGLPEPRVRDSEEDGEGMGRLIVLRGLDRVGFQGPRAEETILFDERELMKQQCVWREMAREELMF